MPSMNSMSRFLRIGGNRNERRLAFRNPHVSELAEGRTEKVEDIVCRFHENPHRGSFIRWMIDGMEPLQFQPDNSTF